MASRDARCFVFVRYWPGFTAKFPYARFNNLSDNAIGPAVRDALAGELWRRHDEILHRRRSQKLNRIEAIKQRRSTAIWRPTPSLHRGHPQPTKLHKTRCSRFAKLGFHVGWHEIDGYFTRESEGWHFSRDELFSPRIWIADSESIECANDLVRELNELRPVNDAEWERHRIANPQYGLVHCNDLSRGERASILAAIQQLWSLEPMDWSEFVRPLLTRVDRFLTAWQAIAHPGSSDATQTGGRAGHESADTGQERGDRDARLAKLQRCERKAYFSYQVAEMKAGRRLEDREAFDWIKENGLHEDSRGLGELIEYELPSFETWQRELRSARKALGEQKYSRRAGRATGRSIARTEEI